MNHVSKHQSVVNVALNALELLGKVSFTCARERLDDLRRWDQNVRLDNYHASFLLRIGLLSFVIDTQMKVRFLAEAANDAHEIPGFDPELDRPAAAQRHLEEDGAIDEAGQNRLTVLIHRWTQFELHYGRVIGLPLIELDSEELIDEGLILEVVAAISVVFGITLSIPAWCSRLINYLVEEPGRHLLDPVIFVLLAIVVFSNRSSCCRHRGRFQY